jgi:hypothetical protein
MTPLRLSFISFTLPFLTALLIHVNTASATSCVERARLVASLGSQRALKS